MEGLTLIPRLLAAACSHARAHGCPHGPSSPECDAFLPYVWIPWRCCICCTRTSCTWEGLATALPATDCTTPTRYRSSSPVCLVVIPWSITAVFLVYAVDFLFIASVAHLISLHNSWLRPFDRRMYSFEMCQLGWHGLVFVSMQVKFEPERTQCQAGRPPHFSPILHGKILKLNKHQN
jgi:hypothetical protein